MNDYCERCGKRVADIHTCTPNPVIAKLRAQLATITQEWDDLIRAVADHVTARGELAAQNQQMRRALTYIGGHIRLYRIFACVEGDSYDPECADLNIDKAESFANEALALPDLASPVLNKIRVEVLREAGLIWDSDPRTFQHTEVASEGWTVSEWLNRMADAIEKGEHDAI